MKRESNHQDQLIYNTDLIIIRKRNLTIITILKTLMESRQHKRKKDDESRDKETHKKFYKSK